MEIRRCGQAKPTHVRSQCKPEKCTRLCINFVVVPAVSLKTRIMCMYVYYAVVLVAGDPLRI
jgi:hypothetical protein